MDFNCKLCNKKYASYQSFWNHNKKFHNDININQIHKCENCNKVLASRQSKWRHLKICKIKKENDIIITNNNITNNGTINNNTLIINNYNNDNISYISDNFIKNIFTNLLCEDEHNLPISKLIENIKFNPNHKENNNVKITSLRSDIGFKYDDDKWKAVDKDDLLNDLFKLGADMFLKFYKEKQGILSQDMKECYEEFKKNSKYELKEEIKQKIQKIAYIYTKNMELD
jgi:hypothetical protein